MTSGTGGVDRRTRIGEPFIPLLLLAAGGSTRMGAPKQLLPFGKSTLLRHAVETALDSDCNPVLVVLGASSDQTTDALRGLSVQTVINPDWARGMGTSIRLGLATLLQNSNPSAVVIMLCDQPAVTAKLLDDLLAAHAAGATLVAAHYCETAAVPALIGRQWFDELLSLSDDAGARHLLKRHMDQVKTIPFPNGDLDIDTPDDYQRLLCLFGKGTEMRSTAAWMQEDEHGE